MVNKEAYSYLKETLKSGNIEDYEFESKVIFNDILKADRFSDGEFQNTEELEIIIEKRLSGYPLQYLVGEWDFYNITLKVGDGVLIPRQDTELLAETALSEMEKRENPAVLDLCSGSGAVVLALCENGSGSFYAVEKEEKAYFYLCENNKKYGGKVKTVKGDCFDGEIIESLPAFDLIVSNPPYLTRSETENLQKEVSFEPMTALFGGEDGLLFYRLISALYKDKLKTNGMLMFEIGESQGESVKEILKETGYKDIKTVKDLCLKDRVVIGTKA